MGDVGRQFRPIAPRTMPPGGGGGSPQPPNGNGGSSDDGRMKRASTACKECQKRRTRCSINPTGSCGECETHGRECRFDETSDKRRKAAAKRTQEDLANLREFVEQLLQLFRAGDNNTVQHLIHQIRSGASQDEIRASVLQYLAQIGQLRPTGCLNPNMMNDNNFFGNQ